MTLTFQTRKDLWLKIFLISFSMYFQEPKTFLIFRSCRCLLWKLHHDKTNTMHIHFIIKMWCRLIYCWGYYTYFRRLYQIISFFLIILPFFSSKNKILKYETIFFSFQYGKCSPSQPLQTQHFLLAVENEHSIKFMGVYAS